jgi:hypothetical protein
VANSPTKFIVNTPKLYMHPTTVAGVATGDATAQSDFSGYTNNSTTTLKKADVNTSAFGDAADTHGKGPGQHSVALDIMHGLTLSATLPKLIAEFNAPGPTPFQIIPDGANAIGPNNPEITIWVTFSELPLALKRGAILGTSATYQISGQVSYWDGTTQTWV